MKQEITLLRKSGKVWDAVPLDELRGMTLADAMLQFDGVDVVAEFVNELGEGVTKKGYFCGTEKWREFYKKKGFSALTFREAVDLLRRKGSPLLDWVCPPVVDEAIDVFGGGDVVSVTAGEDLFC